MLELIRDLLSNVKSNSRILNFIGSRLSTRKTEQPSMTGTTPALPACGSRRRKANAFWTVTTLGLSGIFYEKWKFKPDEVTDEVAQWHITSTTLQMIWRMCGAGCSLIMTLSFMLLASGLLRIDCIGRLLITATLIFSSAGLIFSVGLSGILSLPGSGKSKCQDKWYNTTTFEDESFLLWSLFALPLSSLSWSIAFGLVTVLIQLSWNIPDTSTPGSSTDVENIVCEIFMTALALMQVALLCRGVSFAKEMC